MTYVNSIFKVIDNSGAVNVKCICCYKKGFLNIGSLVLVIVKRLRPHKKVKKGQKIKGYVVNIQKEFMRKGGHFLSCQENTVVLLKKNGDLLGTRLKSYCRVELRFIGRFSKILSLSTYIL